MDLGIEINILTDKNIEVEVQVEEQDIVADDSERHQLKSAAEHPVVKIRDTSRNRLQRLGALYANPNDLSSPIHRTEGQFCAGSPVDEVVQGSVKRVKQRCGKLAELASSISQWEDETAPHDPYLSTNLPNRKFSDAPQPKPALPSRNSAVEALKKTKVLSPPVPATNRNVEKQSKACDGEQTKTTRALTTTKQLTWDPQVINSLEAQGFQRRDSSTVKLAYEYSIANETELAEEQLGNDTKANENEPKVSKLACTFSQKCVSCVSVVVLCVNQSLLC